MDSTLGGLLGRVFMSSCPPDIQPNTRIVAICGISDVKLTETRPSGQGDRKGRISAQTRESRPKRGNKLVETLSRGGRFLFTASGCQQYQEMKAVKRLKNVKPGQAAPTEDGWFLSDFYLFYNLFRRAGANQLWFTCEDPRSLVARYGEYSHGGPEDCRVVLDGHTADNIAQEQNLRICGRNELLADFLRAVRDECIIAERNQERVLLLIFGHGDPVTYGVGVGEPSGIAYEPDSAFFDPPRKQNRLTIEDVQSCLKGLRISVSLLMTSSYSGGWLHHPDMNATGATAASAQTESHSQGQSLGARYHGSYWATAVTKTLFQMEDQQAMQVHSRPAGDIGFDQIQESNTYAELGRRIHAALFTSISQGPAKHSVRFAAQDDKWESEWRQRSGIPLMEFEQNWMALKKTKVAKQAPKTSQTRTGSGKAKGKALELSSTPRTGTEFSRMLGMSASQSIGLVKDLCQVYMDSHPGAGNSGSNTMVHGGVNALLKGEVEIGDWQMFQLHEILRYRLYMMNIATRLVTALGLKMPRCEDWDFDKFADDLDGEARAQGLWGDQHPRTAWWKTCRGLVFSANLFPPPPPNWEELSFIKPIHYLATAIAENKKTEEEAEEIMALATRWKQDQITELAMHLRRDHAVRDATSALLNTLGKRIRSRSPSPEERGPVPS